MLRELAHRLKGTGGTVGFPAFTEPSRRLQTAAEQADLTVIPELLQQLDDISDAIDSARHAEEEICMSRC